MPWRFAAERRIILLLVYIAAQAAVLKLTIHPRTDGGFLSIPGGLFQPLLYFGLGVFLFLSTRFRPLWDALLEDAGSYRWQRLLIPQAAGYVLLFFSASRLLPTAFTAMPAAGGPASGWWIALLAASIVLTSALSLGLIAPKNYWIRFVRKQKAIFLLACIFPLSHFLVYSLALRSEDWLSGPTIAVVRFLLELVYNNIHADFQTKIIGTPQFDVIIDHLCSGYEGIGMITVFLIWYLHSFSKDFRFPAALLLFPVAALTIWLSNCLRIALLIAIGSSFSSDVAKEGFHVNAGWIFFIAVVLGMVGLARRSSFFSRHVSAREVVVDAGNALAIPFLVMLAATLLASAFSSDFQWLHPLRTIATAGAIVLLWKHFDLDAGAPRLFPVLAGVLVFLLWIALVPPSIEADRAFSGSLFGVSVLWSTAWIVLRMAGTVVVVPIAEELAFRGYVPGFFSGGDAAGQAGGPIRWAPFILSSLLFGALHSFFVAGVIAGAVYYLVRQRTGRLWDCIVAHMTTNLLLSVHVLVSGHWSYW
ncbi:exosortase E/protease, VPEID-CTERM system [Noviherbaspirillum sedimenti]|nr:exosortase E/protease, VPEID-CTERM system [Noviherbaspirillum sedimenti]